MPPEDDPRRLAVRTWLDENPRPGGRELAEAGYVVPHWPGPWGLDADPVHQLIIDEELARAGVRRPRNDIGIGWAGPTILLAGTPEQQARYLPKILSGEEIWCQLFSEPEAGSDLAGLATRAVADGDEYVVNGQKIWTSIAHQAQFGILLARTDPDVGKHKGISYFICPMDRPGVTVSPIVDMTGAHTFNQVFLSDVRLPAGLRVGEEGDGWRLAKVTLANERVALSSAGSLWGSGPSADALLGLARAGGGVTDRLMRQRLARLHCDAEVLRLTRLRSLSARLAGRTPGPEASIVKIMADEHGQQVMGLAKDLAGAHGLLARSGPTGRLPPAARQGILASDLGPGAAGGVEPIWHNGFLFSPALTIGGGTSAVQRNIVAERVLGLPREPDPEAGLSWAETRRRSSAGG